MESLAKELEFLKHKDTNWISKTKTNDNWCQEPPQQPPPPEHQLNNILDLNEERINELEENLADTHRLSSHRGKGGNKQTKNPEIC